VPCPFIIGKEANKTKEKVFVYREKRKEGVYPKTNIARGRKGEEERGVNCGKKKRGNSFALTQTFRKKDIPRSPGRGGGGGGGRVGKKEGGTALSWRAGEAVRGEKEGKSSPHSTMKKRRGERSPMFPLVHVKKGGGLPFLTFPVLGEGIREQTGGGVDFWAPPPNRRGKKRRDSSLFLSGGKKKKDGEKSSAGKRKRKRPGRGFSTFLPKEGGKKKGEGKKEESETEGEGEKHNKLIIIEKRGKRGRDKSLLLYSTFTEVEGGEKGKIELKEERVFTQKKKKERGENDVLTGMQEEKREGKAFRGRGGGI